jgi:hypothetical protein
VAAFDVACPVIDTRNFALHYRIAGVGDQGSCNTTPHSFLCAVAMGAVCIHCINPLTALTVSNAAFCIYWFCMVLTVNSDYFLKQS